MPITTVYLIRHAHAHWRLEETRPLSESGAADAQAVAHLLSDRPITAIYSSPSRRTIDTVRPLADRLSLEPKLVADLRERELPIVSADDFELVVEESWRFPGRAREGGEANAVAQTRGLAVLRDMLSHHPGQHVVVSTHGTLLALMVNGLDASFGFDFWRQFSFPDVYQLDFQDAALTRVNRLWK